MFEINDLVAVNYDGRKVIRRVEKIQGNKIYLVGLPKGFEESEIMPPLSVGEKVLYSDNCGIVTLEVTSVADKVRNPHHYFYAIDEYGVESRWRYISPNGMTLAFSPINVNSIELTNVEAAMKSFLDETSVGYSDDVITKVCNEAYAAKSKLRSKFRNHPNWDEKRQAIIIPDYSYVTEPDKGAAAQISYDLARQLISGATSNELLYRPIMDNTCQNKVYLSDYLQKKVESYIVGDKEEPFKGYHLGMKTSRYIRSFLEYIGCEKLKNFEKEYAKIADNLSGKRHKRIAVLSINPMDFLTMSDGNSWSSCHSVRNKGCYHGGTLSYALDEVTAIFYTIDVKTDITETGDWLYKAPKITRQLCMMNDNFMLQSRGYPDYTNMIINKCQGELMKKIYDTLWDCDSQVLKLDKDSKRYAQNHCKTLGLQYPDYIYDYHQTVYIRTDDEEDMNIGAPTPDLFNGENNITNSILSENIGTKGNNAYYICRECGEVITSLDNAISFDDNYYHECCCIYSDYEDIYIPESLAVEIDGDYFTQGYVDENFTKCEGCGEWVNYNDSVEINGCYYHRDCADEIFDVCEECGEYFNKEDLNYVDGSYYCDRCTESLFVQCDECGRYCDSSEIEEIDGAHYCSECVPRFVYNKELIDKWIEGEYIISVNSFADMKNLLTFISENYQIKWSSGKEIICEENLRILKQNFLNTYIKGIYLTYDNERGAKYGLFGDNLDIPSKYKIVNVSDIKVSV